VEVKEECAREQVEAENQNLTKEERVEKIKERIQKREQ